MKKTYKATAAFCLSAFLALCGCSAQSSYSVSEFFAMNTYVTLIADGCSEETHNEVKNTVLSVEKQLSAHFGGSDINLLDPAAESYKNTMNLLSRAYDISEKTDGAFDFTLGALISLWNVNGSSPSVPSPESINNALMHCGYEKSGFDEDSGFISYDDKLKIDLGAIAKGYAGQTVIDDLRKNGIQNAAVSLGGNVTVIGSSEKNKKADIIGWDVAINNPFDTSEILGTVTITDATVSVSGSYERFFEIDGVRYHHIFDRTTGFPADSDLISVAVICSDGTVADALSTALFVKGYESAVEFYNSDIYDFEAIFCTESGEVYVTSGLTDLFSPEFDSRFNEEHRISFPQFN